MKKYLISLSILGFLILPNLSLASSEKYTVSVVNTANNSTTVAISNVSNFWYLITDVFIDNNSSVNGKSLTLECGNTPYNPATTDRILIKSPGTTFAAIYNNLAYNCGSTVFLNQYGTVNSTSSASISYWRCDTAEECQLRASASTNGDTSAQSLNNYKAITMTGLVFATGGFSSYKYLKKRKKNT